MSSKRTAPEEQSGSPANAHPLRSMQWVFLTLTTLWIFTTVIATILLFWHTGSPLCLSLFTTIAPPVYIWGRIAKYLFPRDDRDDELAELKIQHVNNRKPWKQLVPPYIGGNEHEQGEE